eukprot:scaffold375_cov378-Prasinococcus_capsulatus_cf.AAC.32
MRRMAQLGVRTNATSKIVSTKPHRAPKMSKIEKLRDVTRLETGSAAQATSAPRSVERATAGTKACNSQDLIETSSVSAPALLGPGSLAVECSTLPLTVSRAFILVNRRDDGR